MRAAVLVSVAALGISLAGCSGTSPSPKVASLGSVTTTSAAGSLGGAKPSGSDLTKMESYATCMRSHGVPDFPDPTAGPNGGSGFQIRSGPGSDLDPNSAKFAGGFQFR